jgi:MFS family permease
LLAVAGVMIARTLPAFLFGPIAGTLVDRVDRKRLMVVLDWIRVVALGALGLALLAHFDSIVLLFGVLFVMSTGEVTFRSAASAMVPAVVPASRLERANGWLAGGAMLANSMLAGPFAGFLYGLGAALPFLFNAGTYAASATLIGSVPGSYRPAGAGGGAAAGGAGAGGAGAGVAADGDGGAAVPRRSIRADITDGLRFLMGERLLRTMAGLIGLLNVTLTAALAVLVLLASDRLHLGSVGYGLLFTSMAVGGVAGAAFGDRIVKWATPTWTVRVGLLIEAGLHLVLATSHSPYLVGLAFLAFGVHGALWSIVASTTSSSDPLTSQPHAQRFVNWRASSIAMTLLQPSERNGSGT